MVDESSRRLPTHRPGRKIRLADGRPWFVPAPPTSNEPHDLRAGPEYDQLLDAACEADSEAERFLAELALVLFLLGRNYDLGPSDYQQLLSFPPDSPALLEWRAELGELVREHLRARGGPSGPAPASTAEPLSQGWLTRLLARFWLSPTDR
ncbi:oxysterol-binding protein [Paludisphaera soli]|uniref:oxysterol-binding protein n=1 Tax=Paludisphaera soli TaxID=2712865 RepID=UPI0013EDEB94|nr:oxysterol-binding protein [Paludisphaera soli]